MRRIWSSAITVGTLLLICHCSSTQQLGFPAGDAAAPFIPALSDDDAAAPPATALRQPMCVSTECSPPFATCLPAYGGVDTYRCGTDLSSDSENCGMCGRTCGNAPAELNTGMICIDGECVGICRLPYLDCNGIVDDGCETDTTADVNNCGGCGVRCPSGVKCISGRCGCPAGMVECNGKCTDIMTNNENCGACGNVCPPPPTDSPPPPPNMGYNCFGGECSKLVCVATATATWRNCNLDLVDGCESDLNSDLSNCGYCGNKCAPGKQCFKVDGIVDCQCPAGLSACPTTQKCADLDNDPTNCGACGSGCPEIANSRKTCDRGRCGYECLHGFADCNGLSVDGCEVDITRDPRNCGACGTECDNVLGQPCLNGQCALKECAPGEGPTR